MIASETSFLSKLATNTLLTAIIFDPTVIPAAAAFPPSVTFVTKYPSSALPLNVIFNGSPTVNNLSGGNAVAAVGAAVDAVVGAAVGTAVGAAGC